MKDRQMYGQHGAVRKSADMGAGDIQAIEEREEVLRHFLETQRLVGIRTFSMAAGVWCDHVEILRELQSCMAMGGRRERASMEEQQDFAAAFAFVVEVDCHG